MKFTKTNMSPKIANALAAVTVQHNLYVDVQNGNDANDGTTKDKAFKTLARMSLELIRKNHTYTFVTILPGVYNEGLSLYDCSGSIVFYGSGDVTITGLSAAGKNVGLHTSVYVANCTSNVFFNNIKFTHDSVSEEDKKFAQFVFYLESVPNVMIQSCDIDMIATQGKRDIHSPIAVYGKHNTVATVGNGTFKNCGIALYSNVGGSVTSAGTVFENIADGYAALHGGMVNMIDYNNQPKLPIARNGRNYSLDTIEQGTIIETGTNENGTYYKYANGLLICTGSYLDAGPVLTTTDVANLFTSELSLWTFPHPFHLKAPSVSGLPTQGSGTSWVVLSEQATVAADCKYRVIRIGEGGTHEQVSLTAIGRWKA